MPLTFWRMFLNRLHREVCSQQKLTLATANPLAVGVSGAAVAPTRLAHAQTALDVALSRLTSLRMLRLAVQAQVSAACDRGGVEPLRLQHHYLNEVAAFYEELVLNRDSRQGAQQALEQLLAAFSSANKPSGGEWASAERGRLLGVSVPFPVFSAEDAVPYERDLQQIRNDALMLDAQIETLYATTALELNVEPGLVDLLVELGVEVEQFDTAPLLEAPAPLGAEHAPA